MKTVDGAKLRSLREAEGLSLDALADASGVGRSSIRNLETGMARVSPFRFFRLCDTLGVSPLEVLK